MVWRLIALYHPLRWPNIHRPQNGASETQKLIARERHQFPACSSRIHLPWPRIALTPHRHRPPKESDGARELPDRPIRARVYDKPAGRPYWPNLLIDLAFRPEFYQPRPIGLAAPVCTVEAGLWQQLAESGEAPIAPVKSARWVKSHRAGVKPPSDRPLWIPTTVTGRRYDAAKHLTRRKATTHRPVRTEGPPYRRPSLQAPGYPLRRFIFRQGAPVVLAIGRRNP